MKSIVNFLLAACLLFVLADCKKTDDSGKYVCNTDPIIYRDTMPGGTIDNVTVFVATAFTPDGDGKNDLLHVLGNIGTDNYLLTVLSENGDKMFETSKITEGWDGTYQNGAKAPEGNYRITLKYTPFSHATLVISPAQLCIHLFRNTDNGCINTGGQKYYFEDQFDPVTGTTPYPTAENICP